MASQSLVGILGINPVLDAFCLEQGNPSQEYQYFAAQEHLLSKSIYMFFHNPELNLNMLYMKKDPLSCPNQ